MTINQSAMADARFRVPVEDEYKSSIGLATYCFARLEWMVVHCGEKLEPGFINRVARLTAGQIAEQVASKRTLIGDQNIRIQFTELLETFKGLVKRRNDLMHANPGTDSNDNQRLFRNGIAWQIADINALADAIAACEIELNNLYYHQLT